MDPLHHRAAAVALGLGALHAGPALCAHSAALRGVLRVVDRIADPGAVALTFDDGPDPRGTPAVLSRLARAGVPATFFLVGEQVRDHPAVAAEIVAAGHAVGLHADRHRNLLRVTPGGLRDDLARAQAAIEDACGVTPSIYRPPYGVLSASAVRQARRARREIVLWSRWGRDWRAAATPGTVTAEATRDLAGGEIVLLHDADRYASPGSWRTTAAALGSIVSVVRDRGLRFASLDAGTVSL